MTGRSRLTPKGTRNVTVTVPAELMEDARKLGLNVSKVLREALEREVAPMRSARREKRLIAHLERKQATCKHCGKPL